MYRFSFTQKQREVSGLFQSYETVAGYASDEFVERKSRFIGHIAPVRDEAEALDFLSRIRAEHRNKHDAIGNLSQHLFTVGHQKGR